MIVIFPRDFQRYFKQANGKMDNLAPPNQSLVYIVTYSRADTNKFPTRESFAEAVLEGWVHCTMRTVQWVVSLKGHSRNIIGR